MLFYLNFPAPSFSIFSLYLLCFISVSLAIAIFDASLFQSFLLLLSLSPYTYTEFISIFNFRLQSTVYRCHCYRHCIVFFVIVVVGCCLMCGGSFFISPSLGHNGFTARAFDILLRRAHVHSESKPKPNTNPSIRLLPNLNHSLHFTFPSNQHISCSTQSDPRSLKH